jgi:molybdopterin-guanine dinucleotide biosynthesis protein A
MLAGVILAGGKSSRMGTDKSLLTLPSNNKSLLEHCQSTLAQVCDNNVFISGTQHEDGIADIVSECGPLSGIHAVVTHVREYHVGVNEMLLTPVDMPSLCADDFTLLLNKGRATQRLCCFENCFLPLYLPLSDEVSRYLTQQLEESVDDTDTLAKKRRYSIFSMLKALQGLQVPPLKNTQLSNINTPVQWQKHCLEKHLPRYKHDSE